MWIRILPLALLMTDIAACASGPDYKMPTLPAAASGPFTMASSAVTDTPVMADDRWWLMYQDPVLDRLIDDALQANTDIRVALARLDRARATLREVKGDRLPDTQFAVDTNRQRMAAVQTIPGTDRDNTYVNAGLSVAYEVDLLGRVRREVQAARGDYNAAGADLDTARLTIVADTTQAYVDAASAAQRQVVAEHIVALLDRTLRTTRARQKAGLTGALDVARIAALREQRNSDIPALIAERQAALFRLAVLTGRTPNELPAEAGARSAPPTIDQPIPVGDGMQLLGRRPDVRASERRLAAATARIGVATADLYPKVSLGASVSSTAFGFGNYFGQAPLNWLIGPMLSWSFPNQERQRAQIDRAKADTREALATFDGTILRALAETETALSNYARALDRRAALAAASDEAERAVKIVRAQQREGTVDSLSLLDAERTFADAQADLATADGRIADDQVSLFRALGGGWLPVAGARPAPVGAASAAMPLPGVRRSGYRR